MSDSKPILPSPNKRDAPKVKFNSTYFKVKIMRELKFKVESQMVYDVKQPNPLVTITLGEGNNREVFGPYRRQFLNQFSKWFEAGMNFQDNTIHIGGDFLPNAFRTIEHWLCPWLIERKYPNSYRQVIWDPQGLDAGVNIFEVWRLAEYLMLEDFANAIHDIFWKLRARNGGGFTRTYNSAWDDYELRRKDIVFIDHHDLWITQLGKAMRYCLVRMIMTYAQGAGDETVDHELIPEEVRNLISPYKAPEIVDEAQIYYLLLSDMARERRIINHYRISLRCDITHHHPSDKRCELDVEWGADAGNDI